MKGMLAIIFLLTSSTAFAGPVLKNAQGTYTQYSNIMIGGNSYQPGEACFDGTYVMALVEKVGKFPILNEDSENTGKYKYNKTEIGQSVMWTWGTRTLYSNGSNEKIGEEKFKRNGVPTWKKKTCKRFSDFSNDADASDRAQCKVEKVPVQMCNEGSPVYAN